MSSTLPNPDNISVRNFQSCNYTLYVFTGSDSSQIALIISYSLLGAFLLVQMCRLCSKVFSYHKFYIHQAYRFYTVAFFSSVVIVIQKITQLKLNQKQSGEQLIYLINLYRDNTIDNMLYNNDDNLYNTQNTIIFGYRIMTQLMGVLSISVTNIMYVIIGFTWLNIVWGCDFNQRKEDISDTFRSIDSQPIFHSPDNIKNDDVGERNQVLKRRIKYAKNVAFWFIYPVLIIFATYATLQRSVGICRWALVDILISTQLAYVLLAYSLIVYLKRRLFNSSTPLYTKMMIVYLLVAMTLRVVWFNLIAVKGNQGRESDAFQITYNVFISVLPILVLSWISEKELSKQQYQGMFFFLSIKALDLNVCCLCKALLFDLFLKDIVLDIGFYFYLGPKMKQKTLKKSIFASWNCLCRLIQH